MRRRESSLPRSSNSTPRRRSLLQAQANDVKAQNDLVRYKQLVAKQEISQQLYDQAVAAAARATLPVAAAKAIGCRRRSAD